MDPLRGEVLAVNVVHEIFRGPTRYTAIDKRPICGPVEVGELGLAGDTQCDTRHHGGPDKAVYAYAREDAEWWGAELDREIAPGTFGENLTLDGLDVTGAVIGERWRVGPARSGVLLEVRQPRTPCANLAARMGIRGWHRTFAASGRVGAYLAVRRSGRIVAGQPVRVEHRPAHSVTIGEVAVRLSPDRARRLLDAGLDLADPMRSAAERVVARDQ